MNEQKQNEEMAKVIEEAMAKARRTLGGHNNIAMFYATMLSNAGYRKIPENARVIINNPDDKFVVLTMEEYEKLKSLSTIEEITLGAVYDNTRKETADRFAERLKEELENRSAIDGYDLEDLEFDGEIIQECIDEICEEIIKGV